MLLQNLRAKMNARLSGDREAGFTLIELLVVMLILGILAAIAIPAFFNQRDKGTDAQAKAAVRTAQTAMETWATDNGGVYNTDGTADGAPTNAELAAIEETLQTSGDNAITVSGPLDTAEPPAPTATPTETGYTVSSESGTGTAFRISRAGGTVTFSCTPLNTGGCPSDGDWSD